LELQIIGIIASVGLLAHAVYLRLRYFKYEATCLESTPHGKHLMSSALYEYELMVAGKKETYKNWGWTYFYPRKGKRYKVFICKDNHYKVSGYMLYIVHLLWGGGLSAITIVLEILF